MNFEVQITEEDKEKIREMYQNLVPVSEIARHFSVTREAVYLHLRQMDDYEELKKEVSEKRSQKRSKRLLGYMGLTEDDYIKIVRRLTYRGKTQKEIAKKLDIKTWQLVELNKLVGISTRELKREKIKRRNANIVYDYMDGKIVKDIADDYDITVDAVFKNLRRYFGDDWEEAKKIRQPKSKNNKGRKLQ
jgi:transposase